MGTSRQPLDPDQIVDRIGAMATDAASVAVGLGILGVNRLQALRRDAAARLADLADTARTGSAGTGSAGTGSAGTGSAAKRSE